MSSGGMSWWYWFGMWIAGISSVIILWWLFVDAFRREDDSRLTWPLVALGGLVLQFPAFLVAPAVRPTAGGTLVALAGVLGIIVIGVATISYSTGSATSSTGWAGQTKDIAHQTHARRKRHEGQSVAVQLKAPKDRPGKPVAQNSVPQDGQTAGASVAATPHADAFVTPVGASTPSPEEDRSRSQELGETHSDALDLGGTVTIERQNPGQGNGVGPEDEDTRTADAVVATDLAAYPDLSGTVVDEPEDIDAVETVVDDGDFSGTAATPVPPAPQLVVAGGESRRIVVTERSGPFKVGRDPGQASLAIEDSRVSRVHFVVERVGDGYVIRDADSANGTYLNGRPLTEPSELHDGDTIEFGRTTATFIDKKETGQ